jgi:hypothetical protein
MSIDLRPFLGTAFDGVSKEPASAGCLAAFRSDFLTGVSGCARGHLPGSGIQWQPSGSTKLGFPIHRYVGSHLFFGSGTENFGLLDQIGRFSARTWGSGLNFRLASGQEVSTYGSFQSPVTGQVAN